MRPETADALIAHIQSIEAEIDGLQSTAGAEELETSERQYLARCFDLLHMELTALRMYIDGLR